MTFDRRMLYRAEIAAAVGATVLFVLTLLDPRWIERFFDASPDGGDGSVERLIVGGGFLLAALIAALLARREHRRLRAAR